MKIARSKHGLAATATGRVDSYPCFTRIIGGRTGPGAGIRPCPARDTAAPASPP